MFDFANPWVLLLLAFIPFAVWWYSRWGHRREGTIQFSSLDLIKPVPSLSGERKAKVLMAMRLAVICLVVLALARPRAAVDMTERSVNVVDILLILDISGSMRAQDFKPDRLEAAKLTAEEFINERQGDRIGLLVFAGESYIQCPLTVDHDVLRNLLNQVQIIDREHDGTAIGMAIAHGINRLRDRTAKSQVMVLLSDGSNNAGELDPITAAEFAKEFGVKIYTIGVGTRGKAPVPVDDPFFGGQAVLAEVDMDEETLQRIADMTGGQYFRATDERRLAEIYAEINALERSEILVKGYRDFKELFAYFLVPAIILAFGESFLANEVFRKRN